MKKYTLLMVIAVFAFMLTIPAFAVTGCWGKNGSQQFFSISVPAGQSKLVINTYGGSGDCDLYVKIGSKPSLSSYNARSRGGANNEIVTINNPAQGTWYIMLYGYSAYTGVTLEGKYSKSLAKTIVLIHGMTPYESASTYWNSLPIYLTSLGYQVKQFMWNDDVGSLSDKASSLNTFITASGASSVDIVAHSLGVVVFRECLRSYSSIRPKIGKAVLMAGPSYGVDLDGLTYNWASLSDKIKSEITPGSSFIWNLHNGGLILSSSQVLQILGGRNYATIRTYGNSDGLVAGISARLPNFPFRVIDGNHSKCATILSTSDQSYELIKTFIYSCTDAALLPIYVTPKFKGGGLMAKCYDMDGRTLTDPYVQLRRGTGATYKEFSIFRNVQENSYASDQDWGQSTPTSQPIDAGTYQARRVVWGTSLFWNSVTISDGVMTVLPYLQ